MIKKLTITDTINIGRKKVTVSELVTEKGKIMSLIKKGYYFDDEVLSQAGIKRIVKETKIENVFVDHKQDTKKYQKDTESMKNILKSINTLENIYQAEEIEDEEIEDNNDIEISF